MKCKQCQSPLQVLRRCRQIQYRIQELASELDSAMEKELEKFSCIIYD